jgi:hypothetical protein
MRRNEVGGTEPIDVDAAVGAEDVRDVRALRA